MARKQHWMDEIIESLRARMEDAIPTVAEAIQGPVPFGYKPPRREDEIRNFLNMDAQQRQQMFLEMGPDQYRDWSTSMMTKLNSRFGPAASVLYPMLQGTPVELLAQGVPLGDDGSVGLAAAEADLADILGFNPFE